MAKSFSNRNGYVMMEILNGVYIISTVHGSIHFFNYADANAVYRTVIDSLI